MFAPAAATAAPVIASGGIAEVSDLVTLAEAAAVAAATARSRSTFGPFNVPSLLTSVTT